MATASILERELHDKKGKNVVIVTKDGWGFTGILLEFDHECLVLDHVEETKISDAKPGFQTSWTKSAITRGMTQLASPQKLVVRLDSISRLWV